MIRKLLLAFFLLIFSFNIFAGQAEIGVGVGGTRYKQENDGTWYQEPYPHTINTKSANYFIETIFPIRNDLELKLGYQYLGSASSKALAGPDELYDSKRHVCLPDCWTDPSLFEGHGEVKGLYILVSPHKGPFFLDFGYWYYRPTWEIKLTDYHYHSYENPGYVYVNHNARPDLGYVIGTGIRYKDLIVGFRQYQAGAYHDLYPAIYTKSANIVYAEFRHEF